jgi:hypothetical protein
MSDGEPAVAHAVIPGTEELTIQLDVDLRRKIRTFATQTNRPQSDVVRDAIRGYLSRRPRPRLPSWVGSIEDAAPTDSSMVKQEMRSPRGGSLMARVGCHTDDHA